MNKSPATIVIFFELLESIHNLITSERNLFKDNRFGKRFLDIIVDDHKTNRKLKTEASIIIKVIERKTLESWTIEYQESIYDPWVYKFGKYKLENGICYCYALNQYFGYIQS
jgi:hypothetical protein